MRIEFVDCWISGHSKDIVSDGSYLESKIRASEEMFVKFEDLHFSELPCFFEFEDEEVLTFYYNRLNDFYQELNDGRLEELLHSSIELEVDDFIAIQIWEEEKLLHSYYLLSNEKFEELEKKLQERERY